MTDFFAQMESSERVYWYIAIAASVIFLVQAVMTFIGADAETGVDADFDSNLDGADHAFQLFSLRNLIGFLLGFGWTGVSMYHHIDNSILLNIVAFIVGCIFVAIFFFVMKSLMKLAEDNTFNIENTVGKTGNVYITIPANKSGRGKISVSVKGTLHELDAITSDQEAIKTGTLIKVVSVRDNLLEVESL